LKSELRMDVMVEPFEIKIGLREIDFFNKLNKNMQVYQENVNAADVSRNSVLSMDSDFDIDRVLDKEKKKE
jgi:hypothetical protein